MKNKFKSYAFCLGVCASVISAFVVIGNAIGFKVNEVAITSVVTAILGVLVALGVVVKEPEDKTITNEEQKSDEGDCEIDKQNNSNN